METSSMTQRAGVILAGGSGIRLWPLSRRNRPKQLLRLFDGKSLIRLSFERLRSALPIECIHVCAAEAHLRAIGNEVGELPADHLIGEPAARDTAAAIALSAAVLEARRPGSIIGVFTADHYITPTEQFAAVVARAYEWAESDPAAMILLGIRPTHPATGLGYIERGDQVGPGIFRARAFREKPDAKTAEQYFAAGRYAWNSGMLVARATTILENVRRNLPETHRVVMLAAQGRAAGAAWAEDYARLPATSFDYGVLEHASNLLVIDADFEWRDVGGFTTLAELAGRPAESVPSAAGPDNRAVQSFAMVVDGRRNTFVSEQEHVFVAIGVDDLVVVHTPDATLVCRADQLDRLKEACAQLRVASDQVL